jgi:hypothetical protein
VGLVQDRTGHTPPEAPSFAPSHQFSIVPFASTLSPYVRVAKQRATSSRPQTPMIVLGDELFNLPTEYLQIHGARLRDADVMSAEVQTPGGKQIENIYDARTATGNRFLCTQVIAASTRNTTVVRWVSREAVACTSHHHSPFAHSFRLIRGPLSNSPRHNSTASKLYRVMILLSAPAGTVCTRRICSPCRQTGLLLLLL